ncbi:MAG: MBL fold metallo-hydrolase [Thermoflexales bacterium]|nr:MBL fold metallo-hydrolase [Thermoflexales bacterium]
MSKKMTVWGIGPRFTLFSTVYFTLALVIHYVWYPRFVIPGIPYTALVVVGLILIATGVPIWITAARIVDRGFEEGILLTQGVYALCRHPLYGNTIFFTIPGILLFFRSWLLLTVPLFMYVVFKLLIREEEDYLRQKFGAAYLAYEQKVNAVLPQIWKLYSSLWYPAPTGQVTENVYAVKDRDVNMFIYTDGEHTLAIDAAYPGDALREELKRLPIDLASVTHLFLTHTDMDHIGGLALFPNAHIHLSRAEEQMIDGTTARFLGVYRNRKINRAYTLLDDGDVVDVGPIRVQAIATPGHTPGSMSFLVDDSVLFTGDTLNLQNGQVHTFYHLFNMDTSTQKKTIKKLAELENVMVCTAHTGTTQNYARAIQPWHEDKH